MTVGGTGSGADTAIYPQFLAALLGMKFRLVNGYQGSHEVQLAMERNEVQGICLAYDSERGTLARTQQINVLLQASLEPDPRLKGVPFGLEFANGPEERQALHLFFTRTSIGRPFVAPPDVPADRIATLRLAFDFTLQDPEFLDDASRQGLNVVPITGADLGVYQQCLQNAAGNRGARHPRDGAQLIQHFNLFSPVRLAAKAPRRRART